jgi:hypothetical protein
MIGLAEKEKVQSLIGICFIGKEFEVTLYSHRRFGIVMNVYLVITANFLSGFFIMADLFIPPPHFINLIRLLVWFNLANIGFKEAYLDLETWGTYERKDNPVEARYR